MEVVCVVVLLLSALMLREVRAEGDGAISRGNLQFATSLYPALSALIGPADNLVFSPLSAHVILSLTYVGAGGVTAQQLRRPLGLPENRTLILAGFETLLKLVSSHPGLTLETANKLYPALGHLILQSFLDTAKRVFDADVEEVDFSAPEVAADTINTWVRRKTHGKIERLVSARALTPQTSLLLVNCLYFKGTWESAFDKEETQLRPFYVSRTLVKRVQTMSRSGEFLYSRHEDMGAEVLELPYTGGSASLVVVLPLEVDGLGVVERALAKRGWREVVWAPRRHRRLEVRLPRFSLEMATDLRLALEHLGVVEMFGGGANLTGVSASDGLAVEGVLHKAVLEVGEEGTVAAAATGLSVVMRSLPLPEELLAVDHPFLFALVSTKARVVLFMGRLCDVEGEATVMRVRQEVRSSPSVKDVEESRSSLASLLPSPWVTLVLSLVISVHASVHSAQQDLF